MLRVLIAVPLLFTGLVTRAAAQGVCVPPTLKVAVVSGKVVRTYSKGEEALDGATITIRKRNNQGSIVASVNTKADGRFTFQKVRPGKYALVVEKYLYIPFVFPIQVNKSFKAPAQSDEIVINLGADHNASCGGSYAELRRRQP